MNGLSGAQVRREEYAGNRAYLSEYSPVTSGLTHDLLFVSGSNLFGGVDGVDTLMRPDSKSNENLAQHRLAGSGFHALTIPACVGEIGVGRVRIVLNQTRNLDDAVRKMAVVFTTIAGNLGARFTADGIQRQGPSGRFAFFPISLDPFVNWSLTDDPNGRRGWHQQGADKDFRMFPRGRQNFHGVEYQLVDPDKLGGNGVIALAGTVNANVHPRKVLQPLINDIGAPIVYPIEALTEKGAVTIGFDKRLFHWYTGYGVWGEKDRVWFNPSTHTAWKAGEPVTFWGEVGV